MKGQLHFAPEIMIKALGFIFIAITLIATLFSLQQYSITYEGRPELRQLIDYSENYLSSKCITYEDHGTFFKGVFDKNKLDKNVGGCITFSKPVTITIKDQKGGSWSSRPASSLLSLSPQKLTYPIVIKYSDQFVPGIMEVTI